MSIPAFLQPLHGVWSGENRLHLNDSQNRVVPATANITFLAQGKFTAMAYIWSFENEPQDGYMLIGHATEDASATVAWIDSWHMGHQMMICRGEVSAEGGIDVKGTYSVPNYPDWGWRIVLQSTETTFRFDMYNISPEGMEEIAVEAIYTERSV